MQCEICGTDIRGKPFKVTVEGSELNVCARCSQYGTAIKARTPVSKKNAPVPIRSRQTSRPRPKKDPFAELNDELVDGYEHIIKEAREKRGWTQEVLASKIKEKASLIKKIERGEIVPEDSVRKKLEHTLDVKLMERVSGDDWQADGFRSNTTLGDIVTIKKK
ncbi:multiprotein bridging factor aMBF1 [Methanohalophilus sp.]|uniref:multiprotein bridging factor aMBF1 n=1 Tax=Methanohalophilus sp. TaxID=1966352 RepID=UPI0026245A2C|nr:multiprotein bridging factor aMBF1 [Methanohalophilus sp.]MDK2891632.1 putative transcription factor [Methanohalophilus sp.]